jgi:hypothetical protein
MPEAITARQDSVLFIFPPLTLVILCQLAYSLWSPPPLCSGSRVHPVSTACAAFSLVSLPLKSGAEACSCVERFGYRLSVLALKSPGSSSSWQERAAKVASFPVKLPGTLDSRSTCFVMVLLAWFSSTVACRSGSSVRVEERTAWVHCSGSYLSVAARFC